MSDLQPKRFLGLELGGSRRTAVVCLEYTSRGEKVFLAATHAQLRGTHDETADEILIRTVNELKPDLIGVDAPLTFPPCLVCDVPACPGVGGCPKASVQWMREESARRHWSKAKFPPPYTHRPIDLLMRGRWQDDSPMPIPAEEAFGSGRAPLTARMSYLRKHFDCKNLLEVSPRFALAGIAEWYGISTRELRRCRDMEHGAENRFTILNKVAEKNVAPELPHVFLYMTDVVSLAKDLSSFDALLCALMGVYAELGLLEAPELDPNWGYVAKPARPKEVRSQDIWRDL
ncbi:MAG: hypothetical protein ACXWR4_19330 [Bdellovibrionota bacterium]